jgi:transcriptional regulator with XRE-family HTH domain
MDEELTDPDVPTVGERLRAAREEKDLSLDDIAAQTRIPRRHLESIETGDWDSLPAPTYTTGFAKSYASAVGLDRTEIGDQLRAEMGGQRFATNQAEVFEAADPRRTMPKWLVIGTVVAVIVLVVLMSWLNKRSLEQPSDTGNAAVAETTAPAAAPAAKPPAQPGASVEGRAVVLAATDAVWLQVSDKGAVLYSGILQAGQTFTVPPNATAPMLKTAKAEALKVMVGTSVAPPLGPPAKKITVSLLPQDLMKGPDAAAAPPTASAQAKPGPRRTQAPAAAPPAAAPDTTPPEPATTTNTAQ